MSIDSVLTAVQRYGAVELKDGPKAFAAVERELRILVAETRWATAVRTLMRAQKVERTKECVCHSCDALRDEIAAAEAELKELQGG